MTVFETVPRREALLQRSRTSAGANRIVSRLRAGIRIQTWSLPGRCRPLPHRTGSVSRLSHQHPLEAMQDRVRSAGLSQRRVRTTGKSTRSCTNKGARHRSCRSTTTGSASSPTTTGCQSTPTTSAVPSAWQLQQPACDTSRSVACDTPTHHTWATRALQSQSSPGDSGTQPEHHPPGLFSPAPRLASEGHERRSRPCAEGPESGRCWQRTPKWKPCRRQNCLDLEGSLVARVRIELTTPRFSDDPGRACGISPASTQHHAVPQSPLFRMGMLADLLARKGR